jgi:hypothetical protein
MRRSLAFWPNTLLVEKSREFKFGKYGGQSTKNLNSATATNLFEWRRLALNLLKGVFSIRLRPSGPRGPHAFSKALGRCQRWHVHKNRYRQRKSAAKSALTAFSPLWLSHQVEAIIYEIFYLKNKAPTGAGGRADLRGRSVPCKAFSDELAASDITS